MLYILVGLKDVPFFMARNDSDGTTLAGNERFYGFNVDVVRALSAMLNFRYELYVVDELRSTREAATVADKLVQELIDGVSISVCQFCSLAVRISSKSAKSCPLRALRCERRAGGKILRF